MGTYKRFSLTFYTGGGNENIHSPHKVHYSGVWIVWNQIHLHVNMGALVNPYHTGLKKTLSRKQLFDCIFANGIERDKCT